MSDLGNPISYAVLAKGTPVYSSDGEQVGTVHHVLAAEAQDIFDGIVIGDTQERHLPGGGHRFVDAPEVAAIHEHGVTLTIDAAACQELPRPTANPGEMRADPADQPSALSGKLRRAWDRLSGNE
jgi:hypothetical protein